jgi:hypothetical protein
MTVPVHADRLARKPARAARSPKVIHFRIVPITVLQIRTSRHIADREMRHAWSEEHVEAMLERLNSLWVGDRLGYIEQLCLASAIAIGHPFTLYSYTAEALRGVPDGVELRDAREVMPEDKLVSYSDSGSFALGANFFRYALLAKGLGYWVDMDFCFLKPLDFDQPYVFGWEFENWINNALLRIPAQSDMARDLCGLPRTNWRPPWFGPKRSLLYYWARLTKGDVRVEDLPWGTFSSGLVTYVAKKHGVAAQAQNPSVFYPVRWKDARLLFGPAAAIEESITPDTRAVHMWRSRLIGLAEKPPPRGSYLDVVCRRYGIETDRGAQG